MADDSTFIPWGLHPLKNWVVDELKNRASDYGFNGMLASADKTRSTVHTSWARVFSNGIPTSGNIVKMDLYCTA
jgi:hypothetical protein